MTDYADDAKEEAGKWIGTFQLGRNLDGRTIDLSDKGESLKHAGVFRIMVLEQAEKKLKRRGAKIVILPP
jgi:hypothetical protein